MFMTHIRQWYAAWACVTDRWTSWRAPPADWRTSYRLANSTCRLFASSCSMKRWERFKHSCRLMGLLYYAVWFVSQNYKHPTILNDYCDEPQLVLFSGLTCMWLVQMFHAVCVYVCVCVLILVEQLVAVGLDYCEEYEWHLFLLLSSMTA